MMYNSQLAFSRLYIMLVRAMVGSDFGRGQESQEGPCYLVTIPHSVMVQSMPTSPTTVSPQYPSTRNSVIVIADLCLFAALHNPFSHLTVRSLPIFHLSQFCLQLSYAALDTGMLVLNKPLLCLVSFVLSLGYFHV